jgi:hypothetical protein
LRLGTIGSSIWKVAPSPNVDSTQMRPPCISTICLATARPKPVPPLAFYVQAVHLLGTARKCARLVRMRNIGPSVGHTAAEVAIANRGADAYLAGVGMVWVEGVSLMMRRDEGLTLAQLEHHRMTLGCVNAGRRLIPRP